MAAPEWPSSVGMEAGAGNYQGVETPWPLYRAQKGANNNTNHQNTPRDGAEQERSRRKHDGGGQEGRRPGTEDMNLLRPGRDRAVG